MRDIILKPVGVIHSPYNTENRPPAQGNIRSDTELVLEILPEYIEGMSDISPGDLCEIVFYFHKSQLKDCITFSRHYNREMGVFSTRSPHRPNSIGITEVKFIKVEKNRFTFIGGDMLDGTPVLDIKPCRTKRERKIK